MGGGIMKKSLGARTIIYPTPVLIIGTYDSQERPNLMAVAWGGICCSTPPCVAISMRKATYTHGNIKLKKAFTVNILAENMVKEADHYGVVSGRSEDKFAKTNITPVKSDLVDAPYGKEFPFVLECKLLKVVEIGSHTQFIGEILDVKAEDSVLDEKGYVDIEKVRPILFEPEINTYHGVGKLLGRAFSMGKEIRGKSPR